MPEHVITGGFVPQASILKGRELISPFNSWTTSTNAGLDRRSRRAYDDREPSSHPACSFSLFIEGDPTHSPMLPMLPYASLCDPICSPCGSLCVPYMLSPNARGSTVPCVVWCVRTCAPFPPPYMVAYAFDMNDGSKLLRCYPRCI